MIKLVSSQGDKIPKPSVRMSTQGRPHEDTTKRRRSASKQGESSRQRPALQYLDLGLPASRVARK